MMRHLLWLLLLALFALPVLAQPSSRQFSYVAVDPAGSCANGQANRYNYILNREWGCNNGTWTSVNGGGGSGTVTSVSGSGPAWLTWTIATPTTTPAITLTTTTGQTSHQVIGTCNALTAFAPCALVAGDIPALPYVPTSRTVNTSAPLAGGGALSGDLTITCATCGGALQHAQVSVTSAQFKAMFATPITVVAAQGANTFINFVSASVEYIFGTTQYAAGSNFLFFVGSAAVSQQMTAANFNALNSSREIQFLPQNTNGATALTGLNLNTAMTMTNVFPEFTTGDGTLLIDAYYTVTTGQ